jgi:hypothetical protein
MIMTPSLRNTLACMQQLAELVRVNPDVDVDSVQTELMRVYTPEQIDKMYNGVVVVHAAVQGAKLFVRRET